MYEQAVSMKHCNFDKLKHLRIIVAIELDYTKKYL